MTVSDFAASEEEVVAHLVALLRRWEPYLIHFISCGNCVGSHLTAADGGPELYTRFDFLLYISVVLGFSSPMRTLIYMYCFRSLNVK